MPSLSSGIPLVTPPNARSTRNAVILSSELPCKWQNLVNTKYIFSIVFTAWCYASAVLAMALCLSVTSRCSTKTAKRRITQTKPHDCPGTLVFWCQMPNISTKFDRGHPIQGRQMQVGRVKISDFWQITSYISKTVRDRHIVSIKVE